MQEMTIENGRKIMMMNEQKIMIKNICRKMKQKKIKNEKGG